MAKKITFKGKNQKELVTALNEKKAALKDFRFSFSATTVKDVKAGNALKKDIARIMTELNK